MNKIRSDWAKGCEGNQTGGGREGIRWGLSGVVASELRPEDEEPVGVG